MKNYKKIITFTLTTFLLLSNLQLPLASAVDKKGTTENSTSQVPSSADTTPPTLDMNSLKIDKKNVKPGDTVKVSLKASDDISGIKSIAIFYDCPNYDFSNNNNSKYIILDYNSSTNYYEGSLYIDNYMANGIWTLSSISLEDMAGNKIYMNSNNYDFSSLNFNVSNKNSDITPPNIDINSLRINKKNVKADDYINVSLKASDDISGIKSIAIFYDCPNYDFSNNNNSKYIILDYNSSTNYYEGSLYIDNYMANGIWTLSSISLEDMAGNKIYMNSNNYDFSSLNFNVLPETTNNIAPITNSTVVKSNTTWSNKIINGDLYIAPNAVLTINSNVTVTGNIYVLGALRSYDGLSCYGTIYGTNMTWGSSINLTNGTTIMTGSNSISSTIMTTYPVKDIPLRIDNQPIIKHNGKIDLKGATLDIADMYIDDTKISLDSQGTFDIKNLAVGNKNSITIKYITVFGNTITKTLTINNPKEDLNSDGYVNITDLSMLANNYNKTSKSNGWNSKLDLNNDGIIDIYDITRVSSKM